MPKRPPFSKLFGPDEDPSEYRRHFRHHQADWSRCHKINGAKVCPARIRYHQYPSYRTAYGPGYEVFYCSKEGGTQKCRHEADMWHWGDRGMYVNWFETHPHGSGYGSQFWEELKDWLATRKCTKTVSLHAMREEPAECFWSKRLPEIPTNTTACEDPYCRNRQYSKGRAKMTPEDREWVEVHPTLRAFKLSLHPPGNCGPHYRPRGGHQKTLGNY